MALFRLKEEQIELLNNTVFIEEGDYSFQDLISLLEFESKNTERGKQWTTGITKKIFNTNKQIQALKKESESKKSDVIQRIYSARKIHELRDKNERLGKVRARVADHHSGLRSHNQYFSA